jgi:uncharacterized membrane protein (UPF0127 family)
MRLILALLVSMAACSRAPEAAPAVAETRTVTLPDGTRLEAELKVRPEDMALGMMHRDALPPGRAMLFIHPEPGRYGYWMHNVRVPLDIVWMDRERRIVEISAETPPCPKPAEECPSYGGNLEAMYVLELNGGQAAVHGLKQGDRLDF